MFALHKNLLLIIVMVISLAMSQSAFAQHEGHDISKMPGMSKAKPRAKAKTKKKARARKRKPAARAKQPAKKHDMGSMPAMSKPASSPTSNQASPPQTHTHTPASSPSPNPQASPPQTHTHTPASSPSPNPQASPPQTHTHTPGMNMPAISPLPNPLQSPHQMDMNTPMPTASPSSAAPHTHGKQPMPMPDSDTSAENSPTGSTNMGPLMVMSGNDIGIRVGSSDTNLMSMGAMGSGTTWQPASGPMNMLHKQSGDWLLMIHYNATIGVNSQGGPRGVTKFESANWFMPMAYHKLGRGTLQLRGMFSFEPFTFPPGGSPLLFQTGETYKGQPIIDRQHPHDLFMEMSAQYTHPLGERGTWFTYFGYPGEPALGPVAFMHRISASENPAATLAHHLQDSTHISFGVLTTGFAYRWFKLEGSVFNGREPDENRYNFDAHKWNSRSARVSIMPNQNWVLQMSYGFLRSPEGAEPDTDIRRTTASVQYNRSHKRGNWATAFVWGRNHTSSPGETHNLNGYTFESTYNFLDKNYLYTRLELVDKNELLRAVDRARLGIIDDHPSFRIGAYTFGGARDVWNTDKISLAVGSDLTFYSKPAVLEQLYGANPVSWKLFFRIRPGKMSMSGHAESHGSMKH